MILSNVWIGDAARAEFRPVRNWLDEHAPGLDLQFAANMEDFVRSPSRADLVIVGESWPDEFTAEDVTRLITAAPLARIVWITGAWSEAVGRTRTHCPPAWRTPLWEAISRLARELHGLRACQSDTYSSADSFPSWTASRQETWLWQHSAMSSRTTSGVATTVCLDEIADPALAVWLSECLRSAGHSISHKNARIVLLDADPWSPMIREQLEMAIARHPAAMPVALTAWNTPSLRSGLATLPITHVADKLAPESLLRVLSELNEISVLKTSS